jgi:hypothetical protein
VAADVRASRFLCRPVFTVKCNGGSVFVKE